MKNMTLSPKKMLMDGVTVALVGFFSVYLHAASDSFYRQDDYTKWVKANKALLESAVKVIEADDKVFSLKYDQDTGLSASAGHGAPAKLYAGDNAALFESVLESQFASMVIKKQNSVGFLVPETFQCGYRSCAIEFFFTHEKPNIDFCKEGAFTAEKGKCVFNLGDDWYLKYYWRS